MTPTWVKAVKPFESHEQLDVPARPRVIPTPGHTEGHVSLHLPDRGVLITGDAIATLDVLSRERGPRFMPDTLNGDPALTRSSLSALETLDAGVLLPGHGLPRGTGGCLCASARSR